jgi:hypothetical protein
LSFKPNLLCIVPPYTSTCPPAGAAALLGYLKANGCDEFGFLDLRLHAYPTSPYSYAPTYRPSGVFGESFVIDVPDLPLVLHLLKQHDARRPLSDDILDEWFVDYSIARGIHPHVLAAYLRHIDRFLENAFAQLPNLRFVGFSTWTSNFLTTLMAASHLKRRRNPPFIVAGGPQVTESQNSAKLGLRSELFDAVALGEGEETLLSLYEAFCRDGRRVQVPVAGTMQIDSQTGAFIRSKRQLLRLQELPRPDFDEMMINSYRSESGGREIPYQLSRGCTDKCAFCSEWVFWERIRIATMGRAVDQIEELVDRYGAQVIHFTDSLLNGSMTRLREFAEAMLAREVVVPWFGFMRAAMDAETADLIRRAGCVQAFIGIESLADDTLSMMNKRRTEADNIRALHTFLSAGIRVVAGIIPGFPGDTRERFRHTAHVLVRIQEKYPGLLETNTEPFILSPGQPMYRELDKFGIAIQPWPSELIDGAGKYLDIAQNVACTFTGPNQGIERLGEFKIAKTILGGGRHNKRLEEPDSPFEPDFKHLYDDLFLARMCSRAGQVYALLVTQAEKETYERMQSAESLTAGQSPYEPVTDREWYVALWNKLEQQHTLCGSRERFTIFATTHMEQVTSESLLRASPFVVARVVGQELVVVHNLTLAFVRLPAAAGPWFASIVKQARKLRELTAEAAEARLSIQIDDLARKGFVEPCSPILLPKPFSPLVRLERSGLLAECDAPPQAIAER